MSSLKPVTAERKIPSLPHFGEVFLREGLRECRVAFKFQMSQCVQTRQWQCHQLVVGQIPIGMEDRGDTRIDW